MNGGKRPFTCTYSTGDPQFGKWCCEDCWKGVHNLNKYDHGLCSSQRALCMCIFMIDRQQKEIVQLNFGKHNRGQ